jgi:hypothetical protein
VPAQLIKRAEFGVVFTVDNSAMLIRRDGSFLLVMDGRPPTFRDDWTRKPTHVESEIVDAPQVNICRDAPSLQDSQALVCGGAQDDNFSDAVERLVLNRHAPAFGGRTLLQFDNLIHHQLPISCSDCRIARHQIGACDVQIDGGLLVGLVSGVEEPLGFLLAFGPQALLSAAGAIFDEKHPVRAPK